MVRADEDHFAVVSEKLTGGRLTPFLGAGANLCGRASKRAWHRGDVYLPSGAELAAHLASRGRYPVPDDLDLSRVAQYVEASRGEDELYRYVREALDGDCAPTALHALLARTAKYLDETRQPQLLLVTSNYDDLLEQALAREGLEFDLVWYEAKQNAPTRGRFIHRAPRARPVPVTKPNKYRELPRALERPAILKLHGCLDREVASEDSYVITEDSYISYLVNGDIGPLIPVALRERLATCSMLFLGYSLRDWTLRLVFNRIWGAHKLTVKSWAVLREPRDPNRSRIEQTLWSSRKNVELVYSDLDDYVRDLDAALPPSAMTAAG